MFKRAKQTKISHAAEKCEQDSNRRTTAATLEIQAEISEAVHPSCDGQYNHDMPKTN